jgi:8-oxo-dGTP pyrophosphatase MutT (NUDIX family)
VIDVDALRAAMATYVPQAWPKPPEMAALRPAAVLVPLILRAGEPHMLFTQRHADLKAHAGQISFPGGKVDAADVDHVAAALREADEELGIPPACVQVLGKLGEVPTPTGFLITPIVGLLDPAPAAYRLSPAEVAEAFEVSITRLRDPALFEDRGEIVRWGWTWRAVAYKPDGRMIWGATARMVHELLELWR